MFLPRRLSTIRPTVFARRYFAVGDPNQESTFAMVKPDGLENLSTVFGRLHSEGFLIRNLRMTHFNKATSKAFFEDIVHKEFYPAFQDYITSGPIVAMRLKRLDALNRWRQVVGPSDSEEAREESPESLRATMGTDEMANAIHAAKTPEEVIRYSNMFFSSTSIFTKNEVKTPNGLVSLTPSFIDSGKLENLFQTIKEADLTVNNMKMVHTDEVRRLNSGLSSILAERLGKENTISGNVLLLELSNSTGFRGLREGLNIIQTFYGVDTSTFDNDESSKNSKLFV